MRERETKESILLEEALQRQKSKGQRFFVLLAILQMHTAHELLRTSCC